MTSNNVEYIIIGGGFQPGVAYSEINEKYTIKIVPKRGIWMMRTDGTYQRRFLTYARFNDLMSFVKEVE